METDESNENGTSPSDSEQVHNDSPKKKNAPDVTTAKFKVSQGKL